MVIEILFSEVCNLYGDGQNVTYLQATLPEAEFVFTSLLDEPYFAANTPDMIYIGSMTEATQRRVLEKLMPLKERIRALVESGVVFLATGNAAELFADSIEYVTEKKRIRYEVCLPLDHKRRISNTFNTLDEALEWRNQKIKDIGIECNDNQL